MKPIKSKRMNAPTTSSMSARMKNAGMDAIDHFTMKPTIDQNGICMSVMMAGRGSAAPQAPQTRSSSAFENLHLGQSITVAPSKGVRICYRSLNRRVRRRNACFPARRFWRRTRKTTIARAARATVAYVRVSTEDQATSGVSLDDQQGRLRAYSEAMAFEGLKVVVDAGESAKSLQRPGMTALLERIRRGEIARVLITKLDRLTRSTRDLADLLDLFATHDVSLVSIAESLDSGSAAGRLVVNMLGVVAQWEREAIGERTSTALSHKRKMGAVYGPTPFGYRRDGAALVVDDDEQDALASAVRLDRSGASFREIGRMLTERGARPHRGLAWHASSVRAILRSRATLETFPDR